MGGDQLIKRTKLYKKEPTAKQRKKLTGKEAGKASLRVKRAQEAK